MDKSPDAFRTISEVAEWLGVQAHVLRFWESKFAQVKPVKRAGGRRYYRPADMQLLGGIKKLLHDDGLTIKGVQKTLREQGVGHVSDLSQPLCDVAADAVKDIAKKAKVVPFKATPVMETDTAQPVQIDHEPAPQTEEIAQKAEPVFKPEPEQDTPSAKEPATATTEHLETELPAQSAVEDPPTLPSFMHRPATKPTPDPAPDPVAKAKPSMVVDAPDPPAESDLPYARGPLAHLAKLDHLSAAQIAEIAPLAQELQSWLARAGSSGAT